VDGICSAPSILTRATVTFLQRGICRWQKIESMTANQFDVVVVDVDDVDVDDDVLSGPFGCCYMYLCS